MNGGHRGRPFFPVKPCAHSTTINGKCVNDGVTVFG